MEPTTYRLLADALLLTHAAFVAFVVGGFVLILLGLWRGWAWVRSYPFRLAHLAAILVVVLQAWAERICPLTLWEDSLRRRAGQEGYERGFIAHWLGELIYYRAEPWVFTLLYTVFGALVLATWLWGGPRR